MDTQIDCKIPEFGTLAKLPKNKVVVGTKQLKKAISGGRAKYVYLAGNADPAITDSLESLCIQFQVDVCYVPSKQELGRACGIDVGAAAAAVLE